MRWFSDLTIRTKLLLGFGMMWLFLALMAVVAYRGLENIGLSERALRQSHFQSALAMMQISSDLNEGRSKMLAMILATGKADQDELAESVRVRQGELSALTDAALASDTEPRSQRLLKEFVTIQTAFVEARKQVMDLVRQGKTAEARSLALGVQADRVEKMKTILVQLRDLQVEEIEKQIAADLRAARSANRLFVICAVIALLFAAFMTAVLNKTIALPLSGISAIASRIASRDDLSVEIPVSGRRDEVGALTRAFRAMIQNIRAATIDAAEAKRLDAELRATSFYARNLIEVSLDPLVTISTDGKIMDVNKTMEVLTGVDRARLIGSDFLDYFTEPDKARESYRKVFAEGIVRDYPLTIRHASGRTTDVLYSANVYKNEGGEVKGMFAVARDITERKRLDEELRLAALYSSNLIEASLDPLATVSVDGKIMNVNKSLEQATGVARAQLIGSDFTDYFTEPQKAREGYRKVFSEGTVRDYPLTMRHASGRTTDVLYNSNVYKDEAGQVQGIFAVSRDVTERKKIEAELLGYRERLEEMVRKRTAELADVLKEVKATVNALATSSAQILASTTQVAASTAETSTAINETSTTVEEVRQAALLSSQKAKNVADGALLVARVGQAGQKAVQDVVAGMADIRAQMESIATTVVRLSEQTQSIGGIIAAVTDIADQSNLLAVNAAIEATRAGEQGKAFGVVAQEIKSLAEQSKQATVQVRAILSDVQRATNAAVLATERGSKSVDAGVRQSAQTGEAITRLAESSQAAADAATQTVASSQQQVVGMDQIGLAMENVNRAGAQTATSTSQVEVAARSLHEMGLKLKALVEQSTA